MGGQGSREITVGEDQLMFGFGYVSQLEM